jgi:uncharacterized surface protein with fasciclin (FAS1) repeats
MKRSIVSLMAISCLLIGTSVLAQYESGTDMKMKPMVKSSTAGDILSLVSNDTTLSLFLKHINKSKLAQSLNGAGPMTVFVPDNDAFNARTKEDIDSEHKDMAVLVRTMKYHLLRGKTLTAADLMKMDGQTLKMENGMKLIVRVQGDRITVGDAHIMRSDIVASNGVIHVVDRVEIPGKVLAAMPANSTAAHK